jgi:hypothetical protein
MRISISPATSRGGLARFAALCMAVASMAIAAGPAAAAAATAPTSDYGNTVECRYKADGPGPAYDWVLKRLVVTPPVVYAQKATQTVGWRYVVTRAEWWGDSPWKVTYRSPTQKRSATTTVAAAFDSKAVDVRLPDVVNQRALVYHVTLTLYWYRADGSIKTQTSYLMPWMKWVQNGHYYGDYDDVCQGGFYEGP